MFTIVLRSYIFHNQKRGQTRYLPFLGKKKDSWFKLDPTNGRKQQILGWDDTPTCPVDTESFIYIGRTQYTLRMVDEKKPDNKWNVTFYDYTARQMATEKCSSYRKF